MTALLDKAKQQFNAGELQSSLATLYKLLEVERADAQPMILAATIHERLGDRAMAATFYAGAIDLTPNLKREVAFRAASHYLAVGDIDAALSTMLMLEKHLPDDLDVVHSLCSLYRETGRYADALPYARALATMAQNFGNFVNAGIVLSGLGLYEEAYPPLLQGYVANPEERLGLSELFWCASNLCDFPLAERLQAELEAAYAREGVTADIRENAFRALVWSGDEEYHVRCARRTAEAVFPPVAPKWSRAERAPGPVRVGYLSSDFCDHATMALFAGALEAHDRERFSIYGICHTPENLRQGPVRERFLEAVDFYIDILALDDDAAADLVRSLDLDILVDLKGFTQGNRLAIFCRRPAPVQVTYLGFPGCVAGVGIDYAMTDRIVTPDRSIPFYQEKLLRLEGSYQANDRSREAVERASDKAGARRALGLPETGTVFCSFNQSQKIRGNVFAAWMQVLAAVDGSVLWLMDQSALTRRNLQKAAEVQGIDPARLIFAPKVPITEHLRRLVEADIALDTAPYNGHTTTSDALWCAVPVVTFKGTSFAGRVSESLLSAVGLPELVAENLSAFVRLAVELAQDGDRHSRLRKHLIEARDVAPLFDTELFTRRLEEKFLEIAGG
ncbi:MULTISPECIES: hypothetical protein [Alphaproteobacteria]|uniref:O-GlcNAc transferase C-terminal domain-containing protein n=2 Tax=Alphaproteobacteria TaxID=28211 RepID=A0A512HFI4_9HYPH|nr:MULTISPECIES: hypothetical protein [Alphaproteobacteria]GEO84201.1 hypothetical protein RNA01_11330 [Ciceribacter naphthalenivorans]GLR24737.1 hypothetical protein GCM10007920_45310 [Ciceribacter naphthalenivorans]GLT07593.1 hypothetical protein GCM10007926_45310 [Sphingomonas psychrolutea]